MLQRVGMSQCDTEHSSGNAIFRCGLSSVAFSSTEERDGRRLGKDLDAGGKPDYNMVWPRYEFDRMNLV